MKKTDKFSTDVYYFQNRGVNEPGKYQTWKQQINVPLGGIFFRTFVSVINYTWFIQNPDSFGTSQVNLAF